MVGDGKSVLFWEDVWCGDQPLKVDFSRLFKLAKAKNSLVFEVARNNSFVEVQWDNVFSRLLLDRERERERHG